MKVGDVLKLEGGRTLTITEVNKSGKPVTGILKGEFSVPLNLAATVAEGKSSAQLGRRAGTLNLGEIGECNVKLDVYKVSPKAF